MSPLIQTIYHQHFGQLVATLTRLTHDISVAEDLVQDAFIKAMQHWQQDQLPSNPAGWLLQTAKNAAIDRIRRDQLLATKAADIALFETQTRPITSTSPELELTNTHDILNDDMLRLIFTCCHPALNIEARVALCLHTICGMTTGAIAKAFIVSEATMSQRLWRAKAKIQAAGIAYAIPEQAELPPRLHSVLTVIYLIFNEGWLASSGPTPQRQELVDEALRLAQLLNRIQPQAPDCQALLALMMLQNSRRDTRFDHNGLLIQLPQQNRQQWHHAEIQTAAAMLQKVFQAGHGNSRYALMAAINFEHCRVLQSAQTNWQEITALYEHLMQIDPSEVIALNYAVALGHRDGPQAGLTQTLALANSPALQRYYLYHATCAEFHQQLGHNAEAKMAFTAAKKLCQNPAEQLFLQQQITALTP